MIETKRLILRPWKPSDAESLYQYAKDPDVGPAAGWPPHGSIEESRNVIEHVLNGPFCYAVCRREDGLPIGSIELMAGSRQDVPKRKGEYELGYWIGKPFWGQGYIPEAAQALIRCGFETLHASAIWCMYFEGNEKSRRVQEKLGFVYVSTIPNVPVSLLHETRTEHVNLLTRERWESLQND